MAEIERRLNELGLTLPAPQQPVANYVRAVRPGDLVFVADHLPVKDGTVTYQGKLGRDIEMIVEVD